MLFEKYKVTDIIYESDVVTIYVAEHIVMATKRVIKRILKKSIRQDSFYSEVKVLKNIRHPNIPIIYDTMEDSLAYYIIEEYMQGETLEAYIGRVGQLPEESVVDIGIKLCSIVLYLHCQKPIPILFLDIHPRNILLSQGEVYLVDFGSSYYEGETARREQLFGAVGFAAPEQYVHDSLDVRADIYGIGAVLYYLITGRIGDEGTLSLQFPNYISEKLRNIVIQCIITDRDFRFQSVNVVLDNLMEIKSSDNVPVIGEKPYIISFEGGQERVGVTHISLGFAKYLSNIGYKVVYEELNNSNHTRLIAKTEKLLYDTGYFVSDKLMLKPAYGPQIQLQINCDIIVRDIGLYEGDCSEYTKQVLIVGGKSWEIDKSIEACNGTGAKVVLCNGGSKKVVSKLWNSLSLVGLQVPYLHSPLQENDMDKEFYASLAQTLGICSTGGDKHKKKAGLFKRIAKE